MPIFEIETPDGVFEVEAPDEQSAIGAMQPQQPSKPMQGPPLLRPFKPGERRDNADGSYSTEITTTWQEPGGQWVNAPSLWMGPQGPVQFDEGDEQGIMGALRNYEQLQGPYVKRFGSVADAERAAVEKSQSGGVGGVSRGPQHYAFDGANVPGYNPETGTVDGRTSRLGSFLGGVLGGVPVLGPHIKGGAENIAASLAARTSGRPQEEVLSDIRGNVAMDEAAHPVMNIAGGVTGAAASLAPLIAAAPEVFGAGGGGLLARSLLGGASGGMLGAADTAQRGGDALGGAAMGGALGLLGPAAGQAIGAGTRALVSRLMPGASKAQTAFGRAAGADAVDDIATRMASMGDDAMPMDLGPNLQRQAGALASTPGRGQEIVRGAVRGRDAGANQRIRGALDDNLGPAPVPSRVDAGLRRTQQNLGPEYERVLENAKAVNTETIANDIQSAIANERGAARTALERVRDMLRIEGTETLDPHPRAALSTRKAIDGLIGDTNDNNVRRVLTQFRQRLDDELSRSAPNIKVVDQKFARLARQREAVERGQTVLDSGRSSPRPSELTDEIARGGPVIQGRLAQGARAEIERIVGTNANDRVALQRIIKGEGDWNRQKLASLFGQERADRIINVLDRERAFAETSDVVTRNSETAARQAAQKDVTLPDRPAGALKSAANLQFGDAASKAFDRITNAFRGAGQETANTELAQLLTSRDPQVIEGVIRRTLQARARGDLSAQRANQIVQSLRVGGAQEGQKRRPLEITVGRSSQRP